MLALSILGYLRTCGAPPRTTEILPTIATPRPGQRQLSSTQPGAQTPANCLPPADHAGGRRFSSVMALETDGANVPAAGGPLPLPWCVVIGGTLVKEGRLAGAEAEAKETAMYAHVGDRLLVEGDEARMGLIIGVTQADGSPPYIVKWLSNGHISMVSPGLFARLIPVGNAQLEPDRI